MYAEILIASEIFVESFWCCDQNFRDIFQWVFFAVESDIVVRFHAIIVQHIDLFSITHTFTYIDISDIYIKNKPVGLGEF